MENCNTRLFCVVLIVQLFMLPLCYAAAISVPIPEIIDVMKNDTRLCNSSKFVYNSPYVRACETLLYPTAPWDYSAETLNTFLCLAVYDTAYKICQYSSRLPLYLDSTEAFNRNVAKFVPDGSQVEEENFCNSDIHGFTSLYNETDLLLGPLIKSLNTPHKCMRICFDINDQFNRLCAVLAWIKDIDDKNKKTNKTDAKHDPTVPDTKAESDTKATDESNDKTSKPLIAETESLANELKNKNAVSEAQLKNVNTKEDKSNASLETRAHNQVPHEENTKNNVVSSGQQVPPLNNAASNTPNKETVHDGNREESNKKPVGDDLKTTTLSENTQDRYDAGNPEEEESNIGDNIDDIDDTIQQPIDTGNQNENPQEAFEQKDNLRYSNVRSEDDSHFFTYFTVITVACIAGYIGYHNKQKIFAIVLEGRRSRSSRGRRRPSTASYRKLDCTLEEAVTSQCNANVTHVIY